MIQRSDPDSKGWITEWLKNALGRNIKKPENNSSGGEQGNEDDGSSSTSGDDGGIKIPVQDIPRSLDLIRIKHTSYSN